MSKANSPTYAQGREDGMEDALALSQCPPGAALGKRPPFPAYPHMYNAGYDEMFTPMPCPCDGSCKRGKQYGEAPDHMMGARR